MHIKYLLVLSFFFTIYSLQANHIIGGELTYSSTDFTEYDFTMIVYRDCGAGGANFDSFNGNSIIGTVTIFRDGVVRETINLSVPVISSIDINDSAHPCPENLGICVERGVYDFSVTLTSTNATYTISYQRCCRNPTITNIISPNETGMTFTLDLSEETQGSFNHSPTFNSAPVTLVCVNEPMFINSSAADLDGDELRYSFCSPFIGGGLDGTGGTSGDFNDLTGVAPDPDAPPPYFNIDYIAPNFSAATPLAGDPLITINPTTGVISGTPNIIGQFVYGICVEEYRNNVLLSTIRRDYQLNVVDCNPSACNTNSTTENIQSNSLTVSPNPTNGLLKISLADQTISSWKIYDLKGSLYREKVVKL